MKWSGEAPVRIYSRRLRRAFAWWPCKCSDGTWVWLAPVVVREFAYPCTIPIMPLPGDTMLLHCDWVFDGYELPGHG